MHTITYEESLLLTFFNGDVYFTFESIEEVESFLAFINDFDERFVKEFSRKSEIKSAAWIHVKSLHKSQVEWQDEIKYFAKKYEMYPVKYSIVREYVDNHVKVVEKAKKVFDSMRDFWNSLDAHE